MRLLLLSAAIVGVSVFASSQAMAMDDLVLVGDSKDIPGDDTRWVVCFRWDQSNDYKYVSNIRRTTYGESKGDLTWGDFILKNYEVSDRLYGGCNVEETEKAAVSRYNLFRERDPNFPMTLVEVNWTGPIYARVSKPQGGTKPSGQPRGKPVEEIKKTGASATETATEKRRAAEERYRAAEAKYEAELAAQKRQVEEFERAKEEVARKKAEQQAAAQRAQDAFKAEQAAHAERLRQHQLEVSDYQRKLLATQQGTTPSATGRRLQATGAIVDTREAAMAALMRQRVPSPLSDIQCGEVKMFSPPKWTCWGFYQAEVRPTRGSAQ